MPDESHADTLATAVANIGNMTKSVEYLVQRSDASAVQHTEVISKLAVISSKQDDSKAYQDKCDTERRDLDRRTAGVENGIADLNKRLTEIEGQNLDRRTLAVEGFQSRQMKIVAATSSVITLVVTGAIEWIKK